MNGPPAYPTPWAAVGLTFLGLLTAVLFAGLFAAAMSPLAALGVGLAIGLGGVGTLAARRVPPPQDLRLGLRGFAPRLAPAIVLMLPVVLLSSELDNLVRAIVPAPDAAEIAGRVAERLQTDVAWTLLESVIVVVGLSPVVEEFFFRGLLQQGLVSRFGAAGGLLATSLLFGLGHGALGASPGSWISAVASATLSGVAFGWIRLATGSILASTLLHMGFNAIGIAALHFASALPIPGYNAPGDHTPPELLVPALASVAAGLAWLRLFGGERKPPIPARGEDAGPGPGGL